MGHCLLILEGLLKGDIDDVTWTNFGEKVLFAAYRFLFFLLFDNRAYEMSMRYRFVERRYEFRKDRIGIVPTWKTWFSFFMIETLSGYPIFIIGCFVESGTSRDVPDDVGLMKAKGQGRG